MFASELFRIIPVSLKIYETIEIYVSMITSVECVVSNFFTLLKFNSSNDVVLNNYSNYAVDVW